MYVKLFILSIVILIINIPFGYWRANVKKLSWQWIFAVHIPVLFVFMLRILVHVGFAWYTFVFLVIAFFLGQSIGAYIHKQKEKRCNHTTSCLFMDIFKSCWIRPVLSPACSLRTSTKKNRYTQNKSKVVPSSIVIHFINAYIITK